MKTKELIELLNELDPEGDAEVVIEGSAILSVCAKPGWYDGGGYTQIIRDDGGKIIGARISKEGNKIDIVPIHIEDAFNTFARTDEEIRSFILEAPGEWKDYLEKMRRFRLEPHIPHTPFIVDVTGSSIKKIYDEEDSDEG